MTHGEIHVVVECPIKIDCPIRVVCDIEGDVTPAETLVAIRSALKFALIKAIREKLAAIQWKKHGGMT